MIIALKDKLLPLMAAVNKQKNAENTTKAKLQRKKSPATLKHTGSKTNIWPSPKSPTMQYIKEEDTKNETVRWNVKIETTSTSDTPKSKKRRKKKKKAINPNISKIHWSGSTASSKDLSASHFHDKSTGSTFDDVDMAISAPTGLMDYFVNDKQMKKTNSKTNLSIGVASPLPPNNFNKTHRQTVTRLSFYKTHSAQISSYSKLKLLHRCVSLRKKVNKGSLVLDLANFGLFLKNQQINEQHPWYESIWNKYDKLFKSQIDFYFVRELIGDLFNEYLQFEYDTSSDQMMSVDLKKAVQQIIIHIRPYHIDQHNNVFEEEDEDNMDDNEMPFTFSDFCSLGTWLYEIDELDEEDDEDSFVMDIHYLDFVQYTCANKKHVWKKVMNHNNKEKQTKIAKRFNKEKISDVLRRSLIDYGRNGLGNMNMEIYEDQIKEYTMHLAQLFDEYAQSFIFRKDTKKKSDYISRKQFFGFIAYIPSL